MKSTKAKAAPRSPKTERPAAGNSTTGRTHPVIIYPYLNPKNYSDLEELYRMVERFAADGSRYARPITVIDRKTSTRNAENRQFAKFRHDTVARCSDILDAWSVDTCQSWYSGLGMAYERGAPGDVYWLIPGDFDYGSAVGREVSSRLHDLPEICVELQQDVCIGEIATGHNNSKHWIDTYGTFALLYNWFPHEARLIREYTERPRSEFFAIRHEFLGEMLNRRWYAYEQTVVILLHAVQRQKRISRFFVGNISDLAEGQESYASALQQVERTERVLRTLWREQHADQANWSQQYRQLEAQSVQIRHTAMTLLENLLT